MGKIPLHGEADSGRRLGILIFLACVLLSLGPPRPSLGQNPGLNGPYLGQSPPGMEPEIFAPGVVSTEGFFEFSCTFSPDGREFYFTRRSGEDNRNAIFVCIRNEDGWSSPRIASFSGTYADHEPCIPPGGGRLYWGSDRPLPDGNMAYKIWVVERTRDGWSPPFPLGRPVNEDLLMYVSFTREGTLYATGIVRSRLMEGRYQRVERLGPPINDGFNNAHPFIAPDESYLVFDSNRPGNFGRSDLFISFHGGGEDWTVPRNLGQTINRGSWNSCPIVSPDGRYFFFSVDGDIYWVDAGYLKSFAAGNRT